MTALTVDSAVAVVGAGTMGRGIAQVALVAGHPVTVYDSAPGAAAAAVQEVAARLDRLVVKGRLTASERDAHLARLRPVAEPADLAGSALVIEAVAEDLTVKQQLLAALEDVVDERCLLATNTSSLSVTSVAGAVRVPGRCVGLHFFNPAPLLPLVEVVRSPATGEATATTAFDTVAAWGKTPVRCADTPGFVVNRVARPFYAEGFRLHEERAAEPATVDAVLREAAGFRMGPFELTDLIGQDVNEAVTRSVWEAFFHSPKFTPSLAQRRLVEAGRLGRKAGSGWFEAAADGSAAGAAVPPPRTAPREPAPTAVTVHGILPAPAASWPQLLEEAGVKVTSEPGDAPGRVELPSGAVLALTDGRAADDHLPAGGRRLHVDLALDYRTATRLALAASAAATDQDVREAVGLLQAMGAQVSLVEDVPGMIVARTVAMIVDIAADAAARGVATPADIDLAMRLGVNYPAGPFDWLEQLGADWLCSLLDGMRHSYGEERYAPSRALRRCATRGWRVL
ncbi:3-hydroxyacyl-CoA dehydrogenase [Streptomyces sp. NPDC059740]|uniref:3-hydroxyacyl-CoA dehydrogenase n=1 Tax=Streptomyces sp. NPDC059740 TaxID=3346926 RepID=UPI00365C0A66